MQLKHRGFTLIEILVVIAIIALMVTVASFSYGEVRENARDTKRISDVDQIGLAMRLYIQENGVPDCRDGTVLEAGRSQIPTDRTDCADETAIKAYLTNYFGELPVDPRGPGDENYYYYYDANHQCLTDGDGGMVFAVNLESRPSNILEVCDFQAGVEGGLVATPQGPSVPYVYMTNLTGS